MIKNPPIVNLLQCISCKFNPKHQWSKISADCWFLQIPTQCISTFMLLNKNSRLTDYHTTNRPGWYGWRRYDSVLKAAGPETEQNPAATGNRKNLWIPLHLCAQHVGIYESRVKDWKPPACSGGTSLSERYRAWNKQDLIKAAPTEVNNWSQLCLIYLQFGLNSLVFQNKRETTWIKSEYTHGCIFKHIFCL